MLKITFSTYSKVLNKSFINEKEVRTMEDFTLFANALNLNYTIIKTERV